MIFMIYVKQMPFIAEYFATVARILIYENFLVIWNLFSYVLQST